MKNCLEGYRGCDDLPWERGGFGYGFIKIAEGIILKKSRKSFIWRKKQLKCICKYNRQSIPVFCLLYYYEIFRT